MQELKPIQFEFTLPELAEEIRHEHQLAVDGMGYVLQHAIRIGELLVMAKGKCEHGEWMAWQENNCDFSIRTADNYMHVYNRQSELASNSQYIANLTDAIKLLAEPKDSNAQKNPALFSSNSDEWYTPEIIIIRVLKVLGSIDLDPCSNSLENPTIPAKGHYTDLDDGLSYPWHGKVYMNPPYGNEIASWVNHLVDEYKIKNVTEAIALVPSRTDTKWFQKFSEYPRCFIWGRLTFSEHGTAPFPSMVVYLGKKEAVFKAAFKDIGDVYKRI